MAVYDLARRRVCVRVVYDGPAGAGKTTNLRQLAGAFATQRCGELVICDELTRGTSWLDWLEIRAGTVCGRPLFCQIVTVPGRAGLTPRRRQLLAAADVVVFVCDSAPDALGRAREMMRLVDDERELGRAGPIRVLQANKQDRDGALAPDVVAAALGRAGAVVLGASARDGVGVVDTFAAAVRALSRSLEDDVRRGELRLCAAATDDAQALRRRLEALAIDREDAAEMLLEEAAAQLDGATSAASAAGGSLVPRGLLEVPLPRADVPSGFVWPAHLGRASLARVEELFAVGRPATLDVEGRVWLELDEHDLTTSAAARFDDVETARQALVGAAREHAQLEGLLAAGTVLTVQRAADGSSWLWKVVPRLPRWRESWRRAQDEGVQVELLDALASASVEGALLAMARGRAVSADLDDFRVQDRVVRYVGELVTCPADERSAARILVAVADAASDVGADRSRFVAVAHRELDRRLGSADAARLTRALGAHPG